MSSSPPLSPPPQLPYFIDGDVKLTQSNAILRYIARKHNMCECQGGGRPKMGGGGGVGPWVCCGEGGGGGSQCHHPRSGGDTEEERQRVDVLENQVMDFRMSLVMVCYSPDFVSAPIPGLGGGQGTGAPPLWGSVVPCCHLL